MSTKKGDGLVRDFILAKLDEEACKFDYLLVLQGHYGTHGWEDLTAAPQSKAGRREIRGNLRDYRENEGGSYRIIARRTPRKAS